MSRNRPLEAVEFATNPEARCPCVLVLDTSGSMRGDRLEALIQGLETLREDLNRDSLSARRVEIAVVTFDSEVQVAQKFVTVDKFEVPHLTAGGETRMGSAIERALDLVDARKNSYRKHAVPYYRPWIFMITDGQPEGEDESVVAHASQRLREYEEAGRVAFFAVGVEDADMRRLSKIVVRKPLELEGLEFQELFLWLSASMQAMSRSEVGDRVALPPIGWLRKVRLFVENNEGVIRDAATVLRIGVKLATGF